MARSKKATKIETAVVQYASDIFSDVRNITKLTDGRVNCEVLHKDLGWIPYTACPVDEAEGSKFILSYIEVNGINVEGLPEDPLVKALASSVARDIRNSELQRADAIINRIEDGEIDGDSKLWRKYRTELRKWPENVNFPLESSRPSAPSENTP